MLKKSEILHQKQVDHVYSEYKILSVLNHPFIVELKGVNVNDPVYLYFILQYVPGGELFSLLRSKVSFPLLQAKFYIAHIVTIFEYLHSKNIIYRDLKPENILITKSGYLKLTDFGFAKFLDGGKTYTLCGTPEYLEDWMKEVKNHANQNFSIIILGNKCDVEDREVTLEEGENFAKKINSKVYEVSAKTGYNVAEAFDEIARMTYEKDKEGKIRQRESIRFEDVGTDKKKKKCCK